MAAGTGVEAEREKGREMSSAILAGGSAKRRGRAGAGGVGKKCCMHEGVGFFMAGSGHHGHEGGHEGLVGRTAGAAGDW